MKNSIFILAVLALVSCGTAKNKKVGNSQSSKPKLVVGIVVDQMRYDYLTRFDSKYSDNGFKKLMREGFHCDEHHFSYMPTFTGPGHASIFTGTTPEIHGIIANDWYDRDLKREIYCVEDTTVLSVGVDSKKERRSPKNCLVTSLGDQIKMATSYKGKSIGLSIKDRAAILPAGKMADGAYWFKGGDEGKFITSTYYMDELPKWVSDFNALKKPDEYLNQNWETLLPIAQYTESNPDMNAYEQGLIEGSKPVFPYDLKALKDSVGYSLLKTVPFGNNILVDFAKAAIEGEELGQDSIMDWLTVSFSSPDYIGHKFGPRSIEIEDTYLRLDKSIADFIDYLDKTVGEGEYVVFLTADHGAAQVPQELIDNGVEVGYYDNSDIDSTLNVRLESKFGVSDLIESYSNYQFFLNQDAINSNQLDFNRICEFLATEAVKFPFVKNAMLRKDLEAQQYTVSVDQTVQKGWNTKRSGDVALVMEPGWISNYYQPHGGTTHGSPWAYDTHVPLLFYGFGIVPGYTNEKTTVEDIVPTVAAIIGVQPPMGCTGMAIDDVLK